MPCTESSDTYDLLTNTHKIHCLQTYLPVLHIPNRICFDLLNDPYPIHPPPPKKEQTNKKTCKQNKKNPQNCHTFILMILYFDLTRTFFLTPLPHLPY